MVIDYAGMRNLFVIGLVIIAAASSNTASGQGTNDAHTVLLVRGGFRAGNFTHRYVEVFQERGRWIYPDIGYIDFGNAGRYREFFIGAGGVVFTSRHLTLVEEGFIQQATGPLAEGATYFVPFSLAALRFGQKISGEVVYFPYLPLNDAGRVQHILERAKLEYDFKYLKAGGGYGAYRFGDSSWQNKPFLTTTLKAGRMGNFEFWLQRLPGNHAQVQFRYARVFN